MTLAPDYSTYTNELREALVQHNYRDLARSMPLIEAFVESQWNLNHMPWFTEHGPAHSRYVAETALRLADPPLVHETYRLNALERYLLWAAAWLHDIGMQRLLNVRLGNIDDDAAKAIRHEHPNESYKLILENVERLGLPLKDRVLHAALAHIARAHGTAYYAESTRYLERNITSVRGARVNTTLLAAILLMADELHLGYERALDLPPAPQLAVISSAHALKHDCVARASIEHTESGDIRIILDTVQDPGIETSAMDLVERWIVDKLREQIGLVEREFIGGFGGQARISRAIQVRRMSGVSNAVPPELATLAYIEAANTRSDLINHSAAVTTAQALLADGSSVVLTGRMRETFTDADGREAVFAALVTAESARGRASIYSDCLLESGKASSATDVLVQLSDSLHRFTGAQASDAEANASDAFKQVSDQSGGALVSVSSLDTLDEAGVRQVLDTLLRIDAFPSIQILVTCEPDGALVRNLLSAGYVEVPCNDLDRTGVAASLARFLPVVHATAEAAAGFSYSEYAALRLRHLQALSE